MILIIPKNYQNNNFKYFMFTTSVNFLNKQNFCIITNHTNKFWLILHESNYTILYGINED